MNDKKPGEEGYVSSTTSTETVGAETGQVRHLNGAASNPNREERREDSKKDDSPNFERMATVLDGEKMEKQVSKAVITILKAEGFHDLAEKLKEGDPTAEADDGIVAKMGRVAQKRITVGGVVTVMLVGAVLFVIYEGIAYAFDWDYRYGLFGEKDEAKPRRGAA